MASDTLALLTDGDNASPKIVVGLMAEIANYGVASVKRIYGDWTGPNLKGWTECLLEHSIQPVQQFAYTTGKNATDGAMIIDAMDLLYTGRFSGFCIVSSDSDFARLAARLREQAVTVYGFGERKTPRPFITACDKFVYFDVLAPTAEDAPAVQEDAKARATKSASDKALLAILRKPSRPSPMKADGPISVRSAVTWQSNRRNSIPETMVSRVSASWWKRPENSSSTAPERFKKASLSDPVRTDWRTHATQNHRTAPG